MLNPYSIAEAQSILLALSASLIEVKEYKEDWRKSPVLRQGGRFASNKRSSTADNQTEIRVKDFLTDAANAAKEKATEFISKLPEKDRAAINKVIDSPVFDRLKDGIKELLPEVNRSGFDRTMDEIRDTRRPLKERIEKMAYVAAKELEAAHQSLDLSLPKTAIGTNPFARNFVHSDINTFMAAAFGLPVMLAALNPSLEDEFMATDPEQNHRINLIIRGITAVGVALAVYNSGKLLSKVHDKAKDLIEEDEKQRFAQEASDFRNKMMEQLYTAVSVEAGKKRLNDLTTQLKTKAAKARDFLAVDSVQEAKDKLGESLGNINDSVQQGYGFASKKIDRIIHGSEEPIEPEHNDNSKLKWIIAGAVAVTALAVGGAVIYKAETREIEEDEALDGGIDKAMNDLSKFLRKKDIDEVGGNLQEFNKTRKFATYTRTKFDEAKSQVDTLDELGLSRDSVLDVLKREKDPTLPKQKHTVAQRVKELPMLVKSDDESAKLGVEWRKGIINAEIKYGATISDITKAEPKDVLPKGWKSGLGMTYNPVRKVFAKETPQDPKTQASYQKFMKLLDKGVSNTTVKELTKEKLDNSNAELLKQAEPGKPLGLIAAYPQPNAEKQRQINERIKECAKYADEYTHYINGSLGTVHVGSVGVAVVEKDKKTGTLVSRGVANNGAIPFASSGRMNDKSSVYNVGTDPSATFESRTVAWHELSHVMEHEKKLSPLTWNYIESRYNPLARAAIKSLPESVRSTQEIQEKGGHDFPYSYTAKEYRTPNPEDRNSELISTAVQMMTNPVNLHRAATTDREHLMFGLFAMDK